MLIRLADALTIDSILNSANRAVDMCMYSWDRVAVADVDIILWLNCGSCHSFRGQRYVDTNIRPWWGGVCGFGDQTDYSLEMFDK